MIGFSRRLPPSRWSASSAFKTRSANAFFSSSNSPSLEKTCFGSRPESSSSSVPFLIAIACLLRLHYGPAHKIPDSPMPLRSHPTHGLSLAILQIRLSVLNAWTHGRVPQTPWHVIDPTHEIRNRGAKAYARAALAAL